MLQLVEIVKKYNKKQILLALHNVVVYTKYGKRKAQVTLEEFEEVIRETRF
ncbi:hypothetical protein ACSU1N_06790 [Thermogladius sp. 4427co]|uniref:hypothetical protein n=1 Tax=Thermogladius sp. 4427co TaxID=3450718 RepID=UPI003F7A20E5